MLCVSLFVSSNVEINDQVTESLSDQVTKWPSDQMTEWPSDIVTKWQEASQTIDHMVYFHSEM